MKVSMKRILLSELSQLKNNQYLDRNLYHHFLKRLQINHKYLRYQNPTDHFVTYFLPINHHQKIIYLGHHIKANCWIPPGGHIEKAEPPRQTVIREFAEELGSSLTKEKIELFSLTKTPITNPKQTCRLHWDFWYLVHTPKINFSFDRQEFYAARWFSFNQANQITWPYYQPTLQKIIQSIR